MKLNKNGLYPHQQKIIDEISPMPTMSKGLYLQMVGRVKRNKRFRLKRYIAAIPGKIIQSIMNAAAKMAKVKYIHKLCYLCGSELNVISENDMATTFKCGDCKNVTAEAK